MTQYRTDLFNKAKKFSGFVMPSYDPNSCPMDIRAYNEPINPSHARAAVHRYETLTQANARRPFVTEDVVTAGMNAKEEDDDRTGADKPFPLAKLNVDLLSRELLTSVFTNEEVRVLAKIAENVENPYTIISEDQLLAQLDDVSDEDEGRIESNNEKRIEINSEVRSTDSVAVAHEISRRDDAPGNVPTSTHDDAPVNVSTSIDHADRSNLISDESSSGEIEPPKELNSLQIKRDSISSITSVGDLINGERSRSQMQEVDSFANDGIF